MTAKKVVSNALLVLLLSSPLLGQFRDIPLTNWEVPPYRVSSPTGGFGTMADTSPGVSFVTVTPCRIVDTRVAAGFPAGYGPPALSAGAPRNFDLNSAGHCAGIPSGIEAYSLNITVTNTGGSGFIIIWPQGLAQPTVSTINYVGGQTLANAAIVPAGVGGGVSVVAGVSGTELIIDINGYFTDDLNDFIRFEQFGTVPGGAVILGNNDADANDSHGIGGFAGGSGIVHGIQGQISSSAASGSSGVHGIAGSGICGNNFGKAGVLGDGGTVDWGVVGRSSWEAVTGYNTTTGNCGVVETYGSLGFSSATAVFGSGNMTITGTKSFVDPHPTDPTKVIKYVSLEGPEAGTYFRGKGQFQRGMARITVPEDFRLVTAAEGLSVQITPIGQMATVAVLRADLNEIVVQASRNVEFYYTVNGVRATFADFKPIQENEDFIPLGPESNMIGAWSPEQKRRLVANGSFHEDGTVNMETASNLRWDQVWEKRGKRAPEKSPE